MTDKTNMDDANSDALNSNALNSKDWLVPAILVAIAVVLALIIGIVAGVRAGDDDDSVAGQLERWSSCLRSNGANVPLVESLRGGGFRVTVDGSLVEDGLDTEALRPALENCKEEAPEGVQKVMTLIDGFSDLPFDWSRAGAFEFDEAEIGSRGRSGVAPGRRDRAGRSRMP